MNREVPVPYIRSDTLEMPTEHCCPRMTFEVNKSLRQEDPYTCLSCTIICVPHPVRYGHICHDQEYGPSSEGINFCPWCGTALPGADDEARLFGDV